MILVHSNSHHDDHNDHNKTTKKRRRIFVRLPNLFVNNSSLVLLYFTWVKGDNLTHLQPKGTYQSPKQPEICLKQRSFSVSADLSNKQLV